MMHRVLSLATIVICFLFISGCGQNDNLPSSRLAQLFADEWEFRVKEDPLFATRCGDYRFNDKLPAVSEADEQRRFVQQQVFVSRLYGIDRSVLSTEEQLNYDIFHRLKENEISEHKFSTYLMPVSQLNGFHIALPELPSRVPLNTVTDYENYIARLNGFKSYAEGHIKLMRKGIEKGFVLPRVVLTGIEGIIEPHIVADANQSLLFKPFEKFPAGISKAEGERLTKAGSVAIMNSVVPCYRSFLKFMTDEYVAAARLDISASSLPNGRAFYEHRVRRYTTLNVTPQQVHDIGLAEVKRIREEMMEIIRKVGFEGDFQQFVKFLRTDKRFYAETPEDLLKEVSFFVKKAEGQLPKLFGTLPRSPCGLKPVPDYAAPKKPAAYYNRPAGDGTRAGFYYVNTYALETRPLYTLQAISLHEAVPGHHLQIALQQELTGIPNFRRFSGFTVFVEGWALYAERLGLQMGVYQDPYSDFGRLTSEMWRACRLVVDTGIHYLGWSRQQAIDFMAENTGLNRQKIAVEVDRYIVWPGQALAYKMGELEIRELRAAAEQKLRSRFDVREFHDIVLGSGSVPLDVLEKNINTWLAEQAKGG